MDRPCISVIVPVYNVEKYLDRCVSSIVGQTYSDLEVILVDDGSPDACPAMCDEWAERDSRIRVIHKENGGLSDARNAGLRVASGELISFVDSDDWLSEDFYSVLYGAMTATDADLAECGYVMTAGEEPSGNGGGRVTVFGCEEAMERHLRDGEFRQVVWNKLYKRSVIVAEFDKGKYHEDVFWTYKIIAACKRLAHVDMPLYRYFQRQDSIMGDAYSKKRLDAIEASALRADFIGERMPSLSDRARETLLCSCMYHGQLALRALRGEERKTSFKYIGEIYKRYPLSRGYEKTLSKKQRIWFFACRVSFWGACRVRNAFKIGF